MSNCECLKRKAAAVCGRYCGKCDRYISGSCCGCGYQLGTTCQGECAVFQCCILERGLEHCGLCMDFPCQTFLGLAGPMEIARLYRALVRRAEVGTMVWLDEQEKADSC